MVDLLLEQKSLYFGSSPEIRHFKLYLSSEAKGRLMRVFRKFMDLRKAFELYGAAVGEIVLCAVLFNAVLIVNRFYISVRLFIKSPVQLSNLLFTSSILDILFCVTSLGILSYVGTLLEEKVTEGSTFVDSVMLQLKLELEDPRNSPLNNDNYNALLLKVSKGNKLIFDWGYKFSAAGFFKINFHLLPAVLSSMMCYLIFMLQLKDSEK